MFTLIFGCSWIQIAKFVSSSCKIIVIIFFIQQTYYFNFKAIEITAQVEERKILDITQLTDNVLTTIERVLEHAVIDGSSSREDEEVAEGVYQEVLADT